MLLRSFLVCCVCFLTLGVELTPNATLQTQQVDANISNSNILTHTTNLPQDNEAMKADTSKITEYIEGGPVKVSNESVHESSISTIGNQQSNSTNSSSSSTTISSFMSRPNGREHIIEPISSTNSNTLRNNVKPVIEDVIDSFPPVEHKKPIVPRKGVEENPKPSNLNTNNVQNITSNALPPAASINSTFTTPAASANTTSTTSTTTTTTTTATTPKPSPKKPLVTIGNDDEPFAPSHFVSSKKNGSTKAIPKGPTIESYDYSRSRSSSSDYIVPIVGVILSVPLVSILLNVIYKKTKEWWHHRHYSRMDFLIDGMYNN